jgi:hypothetical protein
MPTKTHSSINYWWVTASEQNKKRAWHWTYYFEAPDDPANRIDFGGPQWIKSKISFARIEKMCAGDVTVAYQASEGVLGLAYLASEGYPQVEGGNFDTFDLRAKPCVLLGESIPLEIVRQLPNAKKNFEFLRVLRGTVFHVSKQGFDELIKVMLSFNPKQQKAIKGFVNWGMG